MHTRRMAPVLLGLVLLSLAGPAFAQSQMEMNESADKQFQVVDGQLNRTYQAFRAQLDPMRQSDLMHVERLWLKFRDAFEGYPYAWGGSIAPMAAAQLAETLTKDRIQVLEVDRKALGNAGPYAKRSFAFQDVLAADPKLRSLEQARVVALQKLIASGREVSKEAPDILKVLEDTDRAWLAYRDAEAAFVATKGPGSDRAVQAVLERLTDVQAQHLDYYTHEGNM